MRHLPSTRSSTLVLCVLCIFNIDATLSQENASRTEAGPCDFIIVGAGTAGLALAGRLAEVTQWKICVLERGPLEKRMDGWYTNSYKFTSPHDPFFLTQPLLQTMETSWSGNKSVTRNKNKDGRMIYVPRFRGRGGTSRVYGAVLRRASPAVLQLWPEGWQHEDLTPYYIKSEDHYCYYDSEESTGITEEECRTWHGKGGPMQVNVQLKEAFQRFPREMEHICNDESMAWGGYVSDYNGPLKHRTGCSVFQQFKTRIEGKDKPTAEARVKRASCTARGSSYTGYHKYSENIPIVINSAPVTKILFEEGKAVGVRYLDIDAHETRTLRAMKEVIVAAGAFETPQLLQVSGVGPQKVLKDIGVSVVTDNPHVGENLWDHILVPYVLKLNEKADDLCCTSDTKTVPHVNIDGTDHKTSDLASINGPFSWIIHLRSNISSRPDDMSDIQLYVKRNSKLFDEMGPLCTKAVDEDDEYTDQPDSIEGTIRIIDQWPEYRGNVRAVTASILDKPQIEYGWTYTKDGEPSEEFEKVSQLVRDQIRSLRHLFLGKDVHPSLRQLVEGELAPGEDVQTDEELNEWMRGMFVSALHPAGTCRMPECTDKFLRVKGVTGLRVCDSSAFTTQNDGNPVATLFAMAEKLADMLKDEHLSHMKVVVRQEWSYSVDTAKVENNVNKADDGESEILLVTGCLKAEISYDWISTGRGTSASIVKCSLVCSDTVDTRHIADHVLGVIGSRGCGGGNFPYFEHPETIQPPATGLDPRVGSTRRPFVYVAWCQVYHEVKVADLWAKVGSWRGKPEKGATSCFKLNCQPELCSILNYYDESGHEIMFHEDKTTLRAENYVAFKKVQAIDEVSSAYSRTAFMVANVDIDWYLDLAVKIYEDLFTSSGRRLAQQFPPLNAADGWWTETPGGLLIYKTKHVRSSRKIAASDLDGTVIKPKAGRTFPMDEHDWEFTFPTVVSKFQTNDRSGFRNVIFSNQYGISTGQQNKQEWMTKVENVVREIGVDMYVLAATTNVYRKPDTGMWDYFKCKLNQFKTIDDQKSSYIGDSAGREADYSDSDKKFAENIGIDFFTPEAYFEGEIKQEL